MNTRRFASGNTEVTECGLGCWQLGGGWGKPWEEETAQAICAAAYREGVRFFDTADVYGDGDSERSLGLFRKSHPDIFIATKLGRRGIYPDGYSRDSLRAATESSRRNLGVERIDLTQLHCVPTETLRQGGVFDWLREQRDEGLIARFGASVESVEEGRICLEQEGLASLQVIFNIFRQKPLEDLLPRARSKGVGVIVRLPLASGLLSGKLRKDTSFAKGDHRNFNRDGDAFNVGETFAGLPFETGVDLAEEVRSILPDDLTMAQASLRWILDHDEVTVVIPGASRSAQAVDNAGVSDLPPLSDSTRAELKALYETKVKDHIRGPY